MSVFWYSFSTKTRYKENPNLPQTYLWYDMPKTGEGPYFCFQDGIIELQATPLTGKAIFAKRDIKAGELIWHYDIDGKMTDILSTGELWSIPREERLEWYVYAWQFEIDLSTGPKRSLKLEDAKERDAINYLNHGCDPNVGFDGPLNLRCVKDIKAGEMLKLDYMNTECTIGFPPFDCMCKSSNCRGQLSSFDYRIPDFQKKYKGKMFPLVEQVIEMESKATLGTGSYKELNNKLEAKPCADDILGKGLFAKEKIAKGEPIWIDQSPWEHPEKQLTLKELNSLPKDQYEFAVTFAQEADEDLINVPIDAKAVEENYFYLINHSCDPNTVVFSPTMWIARRDILPGEEIAVDYATLGYQVERLPEKCVCGSSCCRGSVTKEDWKNKQLQQRYGSAWRPHVLAKIWQQNNLHQK